MKFTLTLLSLFFIIAPINLHAKNKGLVKIQNVTIIPSKANDGDSFIVNANGQKMHIRLYFVDCLETHAYSKGMLNRVQEQMRYFGLKTKEECFHYGNLATQFSLNELKRPFTIYTTFTDAKGAAMSKRIYAFIITANGDDLAHLLVKNGLARNYGFRRKDYTGKSRDLIKQELGDLEAQAMLEHKGAWKNTTGKALLNSRKKMRESQFELEKLKEPSTRNITKININTATAQELDTLPGIGPSLAKRIIAARPFKSINEITKVKGIGKKTLKKIKPYLLPIN